MDTTKERKIERVLPCRLTPEEFVSRASDLAAADAEIDRAEMDAKEAAKASKDKIGGLITRKNDLRAVVRDRAEPRRVVCTWAPDWASKSMILRRDDTSEAIEVRTMTPEELQTSFDVSPKDKRLGDGSDDDVLDLGKQ